MNKAVVSLGQAMFAGKTLIGALAAVIVYAAQRGFDQTIPHGQAVSVAIIIVGIAHKVIKAVPLKDGRLKTFLQNMKII